jgi:hypothetical protein
MEHEFSDRTGNCIFRKRRSQQFFGKFDQRVLRAAYFAFWLRR